jgi:uncharacterized protein YheU (UPF0270 family)
MKRPPSSSDNPTTPHTDLNAQSADGTSRGVELDPEQLSPGALRGLVEEYVTREGTDYGQGEWSLEQKVSQVLRQIDGGDAKIVFDLDLESASVVTTPELALHVLEANAQALEQTASDASDVSEENGDGTES